jgi:PTH1 family peptidyl-tRNA hydrolase
MFLIVGLGNPGTKYIRTRHNIGFRIIDEFQNGNNFSNFEFSKRFNSLVSDGKIKNKTIILVKPKTFMNNSGKAIKEIASFYKIKSSNIVIIHDDIDLVFGKMKLSKKRGSAGHKGVESIIKELKTKDFTRLRVGIKNPECKNTEKFVLEKFTEEEEQKFKEIIKQSLEVLNSINYA